jgi:DNA/RNA-binding domain of Phe-tRNA-synthetase-like protein
MALALSIDPELAPRVRLGVLVLEDVTVRAALPGLREEVEAESARLRERYKEVASGDVPGAAEARALYKSLGLDPTKTRPSNEALLRRVLKGEALYQVNTLVDALNLCSVREQVPFGLYDLDRVSPPITLRRGRPGEAYEGIRKGEVHVEGRPVLADTNGPFGNPTSDSARSMITESTRRALVTAYAPASVPASRLDGVLERTAATLTRFSGGRLVERAVLP